MLSMSCHCGTDPDDHRMGMAIGEVSGNIDRATLRADPGSCCTTMTAPR
jgi:hypothetical protein